MIVERPTRFNFAGEVMERWARERPDALALWCVDDAACVDHKLSFRQLAGSFRRAAGLFHTLGVRRGDRVLVTLPRVPQWWIAMLGLTKLGAVPIPGTPLLTAKDIRYRVETAGVSAIITDAEGAAKLEDFEGIRLLVGAERPGWINFESGLRDAAPDHECEPTRS